jgi:hypothetical protein
MKCQQCEKPATFHITELTGGKPQELHLCETCAKSYLMQGDGPSVPVAPSLANMLAKQLKLGQATEELARLDQRSWSIASSWSSGSSSAASMPRATAPAPWPSTTEQFSVMVNEEDHLRIQVMHSGLDLENAWERRSTSSTT